MRARNRASLAQRIVNDPREAIALVLRNNPEAVTAALFRMGFDARTTRERVDVLRTLDKRSLMEALSVDLRLDRLSSSDITGLQRIVPANVETGLVRAGFGNQPGTEDPAWDDVPGVDDIEADDADGGSSFDWGGLVETILGAGVDLMDDGGWNMLLASWLGQPAPQPAPPPPNRPTWMVPALIVGGVLLLAGLAWYFIKAGKK